MTRKNGTDGQKRLRPRKVAVILPKRPTQEDWARMSARAAKGGRIIGARPKGNQKGD